MSRRIFLWVILCGAVVAFFAGYAPLRSLCREAVYPFQHVALLLRNQIGERCTAAWRGLCDGPSRQEQQLEVERLRVMLHERERLVRENQALRQALGWAKAQKTHVVVAPVWSHGGGLGAWPRLTLGVGSAQGVKAGDVVMAPEGVVGRIAEGVSRHRSEVILLSDPLSRTAVEIPGVAKGILHGAQGEDWGRTDGVDFLYSANPMVMRFIGKDAPLQLRQQVLTEGSGGTFPKGLPVGQLVSQRPTESGLLMEALVEPFVNPALLDTVFVITQRPEKDHAH